MANTAFLPIEGIVQNITPMQNNCCQQMVSIRNSNGITNMIISTDTYVINETRLRSGMPVTAFYDGNAPVPLIFPPQYQALIIGRRSANENIAVNYFNNDLVAMDQSLRLNISPFTEIVTSNGQLYTCALANQLLIIYYSLTTRSIPPQTTPRKIIVLC